MDLPKLEINNESSFFKICQKDTNEAMFSFKFRTSTDPAPYSHNKSLLTNYVKINTEYYIDERIIKYLGYRSNNDRRAHGKQPLRFRQIELFHKRYPKQTREYLIGERVRKYMNRELESSLFYGRSFTIV